MKKLLAGMLCLGCASTWAADGRFEIAQFMMPYTITNSGSYVVTENLSASGANGISINASHVTLDLNGFQLVGSGGDNGIIAAGKVNIRVINGAVRNWGKGLTLTSCDNIALQNLVIASNLYSGAETGNGTIVEDCNVFLNGVGLIVGEASVITRCVVRDNGSVGISVTNGSSSISFCTVRENGNDGIRAGPACSIVGCTARSNGGHGIEAGPGSQISECVGYQNQDGIRLPQGGGNIVNSVAFNNHQYGFRLGDACSLSQSIAATNDMSGVLASSNCYIFTVNSYQNGQNGFEVSGAANRLDMNHAGLNALGYFVAATNNLLVRNSGSANGNGTLTNEFAIVANNIIGNVVSDANTNNAWVNFNH